MKNIKVIDRRIARTKQKLTNSLKELIIEKGYECVTVQDVLSRANVGRSTFYSHYESIEQLLPCEDNFYKLLSEQQNGHGINFRRLYEHVAENDVLARVLLSGKGGEIVTGHLKNVLVLMIRESYEDNNEPKMFTLLAEAAASALVSMLVTWYLQGMLFSPQVMAQKSRGIIKTIFNR